MSIAFVLKIGVVYLTKMLMCGIMVVIIGVCEMKVVKNNLHHYYISLLVFLLGLGLVPAGLTASGAFAETEQATDRAPEITEVARTEAEAAISQIEIASIEESFQTDYVESTPVVQTPDQINIAGNTVPIFYSSNTLIDAGSQVGLYGDHFLYGHNTANVFGGLANLGIGARFTVSLGGVTRTYQVVNSDLQTKSHFEGSTTRTVQMSGMKVTTSMKIMKAITAYGEYNGATYDYILMTCAGTSYGNGDASHRLILMANEI